MFRSLSAAFMISVVLCMVGCNASERPGDTANPKPPRPAPVEILPAARIAEPPRVENSAELPALRNGTGAEASARPVEPNAQPQAGRAVDPSEATQLDGPTGRIAGVVIFAEKQFPATGRVTNDKDVQACGTTIPKLELLISQENRGIANVVLWLDDVKLPEGYQPRRQDLRLAAQRCQFRPRVSAMTVGSEIQLINADIISHTAVLSGANEQTFRLAPNRDEFTTEARTAGVIKVHCEEHEWMEAFVRVDPHSFHDVTDSEGEFVIGAVPVGTYKLKAWHEKFQEQETEVAVRANEQIRIELRYPPKRRDAKDSAKLRK